MDSLKSRIDYLEARAASSVGATERELEELMQVRDALGVGAADVGGLANRLEELMEEPGALLELETGMTIDAFRVRPPIRSWPTGGELVASGLGRASFGSPRSFALVP